MKEEYLDIVDENNNPTGEKKLRSEVHVKGYWHRTVHIYFFRVKDSNFEILVHLRSRTKDLHTNCWDARFGGHLKSGQNPAEVVIEEIKEEIGLEVYLKNLIQGPINKTENYPNNEFNYVYFYNFNGDISELKFEDDKVEEVRWMSVDNILEDILSNPNDWSSGVENFKRVIKDLKHKYPLNSSKV